MNSIHLLVDGSNGIYVPKRFAQWFSAEDWHCEIKDFEILQDENHEYYWDIWDEVLDNAQHTDELGNVWNLWQDGDLWAICTELMTDKEKLNFFGD